MAYITKFKDVGSVVSSSDQFGSKMHQVARGQFARYPRGVFIGTGSGVVAQYFIHTLIPFVFVEKHPDFVELFRQRFGKQAEILGGDFFDLPMDESHYGLANSLIVSCMPITGPFYSERLVERFAEALDNGSTIIQMGYIPVASQIRLFKQLRQLGYSVERRTTVMFNIPPASIFVLSKPCH